MRCDDPDAGIADRGREHLGWPVAGLASLADGNKRTDQTYREIVLSQLTEQEAA